MKGCILSMQNVQNFGSLLQSYSMKRILESLGHDVSFIDIEAREDDNLLMKGKTQSYSFECGKRGVLGKLQRIDRYAFNRLHIRKLANSQNNVFNDFRQNVLSVNSKLNDEQYDFCVIGSDEVFNCNAASKWGFTSQLFGDVRQANQVITYAASCGPTTYDKLPDGVREKIRDTFRKVCSFSVRDKNTEEFVFQLTGSQPNVNLDPVLVYNFEKEMENVKMPHKIPERFCIVYSYYNRMRSLDEIKAIKKLAKEEHMEIVSIGAPQMWIHNHLVLNPFQVLRLFKEAQFVITDTFHGTIFASKYSQKFAVITRESNRNKLLDLISRLGIQKHVLNSINDLETVYKHNKEQAQIDTVCTLEREKTIQYLKESLEHERK